MSILLYVTYYLEDWFKTMIVCRSLSIIRHVLISSNPTISKHLSSLPLTSSSSTPSTPMKLNLKMKELIESRRYKDALDLFERHSGISTDITLNLALKACSKLRDCERGVRIHQRLSPQTLANPFIQASLVHFYSEWSSLVLIRTFVLIDAKYAANRRLVLHLLRSFLWSACLVSSAMRRYRPCSSSLFVDRQEEHCYVWCHVQRSVIARRITSQWSFDS